VVPNEVDLHCLAGLIKAWFRELPTGVLDSLTPEQVMHCNTVEECALLASMLPSVEAALLDWAINLMADVVELENYNKMNARNIAMVFAPNMTQVIGIIYYSYLHSKPCTDKYIHAHILIPGYFSCRWPIH
jgi:hypothetical protein